MMPNMQNICPTWLSASYYQNIPHHEVNWGQLAQQWMAMKTAENRFMNVASVVQHHQQPPPAIFQIQQHLPQQQLSFSIPNFPPTLRQQRPQQMPMPTVAECLQMPPSVSQPAPVAMPTASMHSAIFDESPHNSSADSQDFPANLFEQNNSPKNYGQPPPSQRTPLFPSFDGGTGASRFSSRPPMPQQASQQFSQQQQQPGSSSGGAGHSAGLLPTPQQPPHFRPPPLMMNQVMHPAEYANFSRPPAVVPPDYQQSHGVPPPPIGAFEDTYQQQTCFTPDDEAYGLTGPFAEQYQGSFAEEQFFGHDMDYRTWRPPLLETDESSYYGAYSSDPYSMNGMDSTAAMMFDMQQRKLLPLWIREGLEKMEKEKLKQKEKEDHEEYLKKKQAEKRERLAREGKSRFEGSSDSEEESDDVQDGVKEDAEFKSDETAPRPSNAETKSDHEEDEDDLQVLSVEEQRAHLMAKLRKWLTEILMEVTTKEIETIVFETHKSKLKRAQPKVLAQTSALVTITSLGTDYGSGTEDDDDENDEDSDNREEEKREISPPNKSVIENSPSVDEDSFKRPLFPVSSLFVSKKTVSSTVNGTATTVENTSNAKDIQLAEYGTSISVEPKKDAEITKSEKSDSKSSDKHHHHYRHSESSSLSSSKRYSDSRKRSGSKSPKRHSDSKRSKIDKKDDGARSGRITSSSSSSSKRRSRSKSKDRKKEKSSHRNRSKTDAHHHSNSGYSRSSGSSKKSRKSSRSRSKSKERSSKRSK